MITFMENTNTIHFEGDKPEWFYAVGEKYRGPFKAAEIYQKLQSKELSWIDYLYREKEGKWIRVADHDVFKPMQAAPPSPKPNLAPPPPPVADEIKWFLYQNDAQTGPYSTTELRRLVQSSQVIDGAFVWQEAFSGWKLANEVNELKVEVKPSMPTPPPVPVSKAFEQNQSQKQTQSQTPSDKRTAPRKPLVAQVYATNLSALITGICRDISVGGMQVLTDHLPGPVGTSIRLNVTPPSDTGLSPFVAEGVLVRILEDQRGFSFRFTQISEDSKHSIERYIS